MADNKGKSNANRSEATEEEQLLAAPNPDASAYVLQPTGYELPPRMATLGEIPEGRFMEEVEKGSEEEDSSTSSWEAHPAHNQPVYGVTEDGPPDTSGRVMRRSTSGSSSGAKK